MLHAEICPELVDCAEGIRHAVIAMKATCQCPDCQLKCSTLIVAAELIECMAWDYLHNGPKVKDEIPF